MSKLFASFAKTLATFAVDEFFYRKGRRDEDAKERKDGKNNSFNLNLLCSDVLKIFP